MKKWKWILILAAAMLLFGAGCSDDDSGTASVKVVYVSLAGSDSNPGTMAAPLLTIQTALEKAATNDYDTIRIAGGTYTPGNGLLTNDAATGYAGVYISGISRAITIEGGWDSVFSNRSGSTILDASNTLSHCVVLQDSSNLTLDNLILVRGNADTTGNGYSGSSGGGIYLTNASFCRLTNIMLSNNYAISLGGGFFIMHGVSNTIHATCYSNSSFTRGGGGMLYYTIGHTITSTFISNSSQNGGGLHIMRSTNTSVNSTFLNNYGWGKGGGLHLFLSGGNNVNSTVLGNSTASDKDGGGILVEASSNQTISGTISGNNRAAIYLHASPGTRIINAALTNCTGTNIISVRYSHTTGLVISNCLFGGSQAGTTAIFEIDASDITGQTLVNNAFITNTMDYLYRDFNNGYSASFTDLNNNTWSGATTASGNVGVE